VIDASACAGIVPALMAERRCGFCGLPRQEAPFRVRCLDIDADSLLPQFL
jgi:hypothetical protein